jgi:glucose-1-phosphate thymidylyltransferase
MVVDCRAGQGGHASAGAKLTALEEVANRPIVHHVLDALREVSSDGVIVVGGADDLIDTRASLREHASGLDGVQFTVRRAGTDILGALQAVAPLVGDTACVIQPADGLLDQPLSALIDLLEGGSMDLVLLTAKQGEKGAGDAALVEAADQFSQSLGDIGVFGPRAFARAAAQLPGADGADLAGAGRTLAAGGGRVGLYPGEGWHRYRGHGDDLLAINRVVLDRLTGSIPPSARAGNRFEGQILIDPTATVRSSAITGPTVIGPGASVVDSYLGPYTAIGAGARIEGVEIERSIVSPGASVIHIGGRLVSSIVGRDARVYRDFSLPRALRLWVGSGDEVALC